MTFTRESLANSEREGEVHVVATEQEVIADGNAAKRQLAIVVFDHDGAEVGRAAADVADQEDVARTELLRAMHRRCLHPGVERCLRLLEQVHVRQPRRIRGSHRELPRRRVERCGHRQVDLLALEPGLSVAARDLGVPGVAQMSEIRGRRLERRATAELGARRRHRSTAGLARCRSTRALQSHDFADETTRSGASAARACCERADDPVLGADAPGKPHALLARARPDAGDRGRRAATFGSRPCREP